MGEMKKDGKIWEKMWEQLERYTNGNDILKYQNMVKRKSDPKNMEKIERDAKICNCRHVTNVAKMQKIQKVQ